MVNTIFFHAENPEHFLEKGYWDAQLVIDSLYVWQDSNYIDDI